MNATSDIWNSAVATLLAHVVSPALHFSGLAPAVAAPDELAECLLIGIAQILVIGIVFLPLEIFAPAERTTDGKYARVDFTHTLVNLLGIIPFGTYLVLVPISDSISRLSGSSGEERPWHIGCLMPWFNEHPLVLFMVYFVILDFAAWVMHRLQHKWQWWWALHSLHHSQRHLNRWSDDRGNVIDSILQAAFVGSWGIIIGTPPVEYGAILFLGKMIESFSHANTRIGFGSVFDKVLVDPRFHRQHHMVARENEPELHDCNFGFVFPLWDIVFGTALYDGKIRGTGVNDPDIDADNNMGWWEQQVASTRRALRVLRPKLNDASPIASLSEATSLVH